MWLRIPGGVVSLLETGGDDRRFLPQCRLNPRRADGA